MNKKDWNDKGVIVASGAVVYRLEGQTPVYLLLRNRMHGTWAPPKGHMERGETLIECAEREILEEIGKDVTIRFQEGFKEVTRYTVKEKGREYAKEVTYFLACIVKGEPALSQEHDDMVWTGLKGAEKILQFDDLKGLLAKAELFLGSERDGR